MSDNKPPMTLYFRENISTIYMDGSHMNNRFGQAFANRKREADVGPYVHLKHFMEEVERRASPVRFQHARNSAEAGYYAMLELAKEIMEGKS